MVKGNIVRLYINFLNSQFKILSILTFVTTLFSSIYILNKGFEITDESYYVLNAKYPDSILIYNSAQHWILSPLWIVTKSLTSFRLIGMMLLIISSCVLSFGSISLLREIGIQIQSKFNQAVIFMAAIISSLFYGQTINFSPSYNLIATASCYTAFGLTFLMLRKIDSWYKVLITTFISFFMSIQFICKPPAALTSLLLLMLLVIFFENRRIIKLIYILATFFIFTLLFVSINTSLKEFSYAIKNGLELYELFVTENLLERFIRSAGESFLFWFNTIKLNFVLISLIVIYKIYQNKVFAIGFCFFIIILIVKDNFISFDFYSKNFVAQITLIALILISIMILALVEVKKNISLFVFLVVLFFLPYSMAFGTANNATTQIIISLAPWGIIISTITNLKYPIILDSSLSKILLVVYILFIASQMVLNIYKQPYNIVSSYREQDTEVEIQGLGRIKIDLATKGFIEELKSVRATCAIPEKSPFFGFYNMPGVALGLDAVPPIFPWLNNLNQAEYILNFYDKLNESHIVAIQSSSISLKGEIPKFFERNEKDYVYCGSATNPFPRQTIQFWYKN